MSNPRNAQSETLAWLLVLPLLLGTGGCEMLPLEPGPGATTSSDAGGSTAASADPSTAGSTGAIPGSITGSGASGNTPPIAALPPPAESRDLIERIRQRFGIDSISGSGATPDVLNRLEQCYARYPAGSFRALDVAVEPATTIQDNGSGQWSPLDDSRREVNDPVEPTRGKITYYGTPISDWTIVHEMTHHVSLLMDASFGRRAIDTMGYLETTGRASDTELRYVNYGNFSVSNVPAGSFPTEYSHREGMEHLAEIMTTHLFGGQVTNGDNDPNFTGIPAALQPVLSAKLGNGGVQP